MTKQPRVFLSYSHDSEEHKNWVLNLATRLRENGVNVILDQWHLKLGDDIPTFMENELNKADYILAVCSNNYAEKISNRKGGVAYEKQILTAELMKNSGNDNIIPIIRDKKYFSSTILNTKNYLDFTDDEAFEIKYKFLLFNLYGQLKAPDLGPNPFESSQK